MGTSFADLLHIAQTVLQRQHVPDAPWPRVGVLQQAMHLSSPPNSDPMAPAPTMVKTPSNMSPHTLVPKAKAMENALQRLRAKVISGELSPGEQIRRQEMAELLGVSRVPLREALNVLADQGLLLHRPNCWSPWNGPMPSGCRRCAR